MSAAITPDAQPSSASAMRAGKVLYHIAAIIIVVAWGVSFVSTKIVLDAGVTPTEIYIYRFAVAYLLVLLVSHDRLWANSWRDELLLLVCGICGNCIYYLAENTAMEYTLVSNVSLITTMSPMLTALLLGALYKSEGPSRGMYLGSTIAFLGVACVIFNSSFVIKMNPAGDLLSLAAALSFAIYTLVLRHVQAFYSVMFISRKTFFYGVVTGLPFLLVQPEGVHFSVLASPAVWGNLLFLAVVCSMVAFIVWAEAIRRIGTVTTNNYIYFQPIVTLIASAFILSEKVTLVGYIGCAMILIGVYLGDRLSQKKI